MDAQVTKVRPITVAILALGGEGGGVLADWMVDLAEHSGYLAQATSVPGVAQRTGATIYYVELFPKAAAQAAGRATVLALMPVPGDVDIVLASELMEGARAIERDFVTPERTLLIASTHRVFAMTEKIALADGRVDAAPLLARFQEIERQHGNGSGALLAETARQLALAMAYEDTIRVAELKIRSNRFARVREEVRIEDGQILEIAEFFHPRTQEIADTLPAALGRWLLRTRWARGLVDRATRKGRVIKTTSIAGFLLLFVLAKLKRLRRRSLRFSAEQAVLAHWLNVVAATARTDYSLAVQVARMRNLVKGYGDTRERGQAKFDQLMVLVPRLLGRTDSGATLEALIKAAL